jgi:hypothetical protein
MVAKFNGVGIATFAFVMAHSSAYTQTSVTAECCNTTANIDGSNITIGVGGELELKNSTSATVDSDNSITIRPTDNDSDNDTDDDNDYNVSNGLIRSESG